MFIDEAIVTLSGGHGGAGLVSFGKMAHSGPDGGNGGKGGNVYVKSESDLTLLAQFSRKTYFSAEAGEPGGKNKRTGRNGNDLEIKLPMGTSIIDKETGKTIIDLGQTEEKVLICSGGLGGRGNYEFRSARRTTPMFAQPGLPGEKKDLILNLKLIADFGLVGLPNAGKSSLLNEITNAKAKTAEYSFTTLTPNLGVYNKKIFADIPGLIEGASSGKGLGISFLKHIEKVKVILHCLSSETEDPVKDYGTVRKEMEKYSKKIIKKKEIIILTKSDLADARKIKELKKMLGKLAQKVVSVSIHDWDSLNELKNTILLIQ